MKLRSVLRSAAALALIVGAGSAFADQASDTFLVTAQVQSNCEVTASDLAFGQYIPGAGAVESESNISVRCSNGTPYTVALNGGTTEGGSIAQRLMTSGDGSLEYNLFLDDARTSLWGDGTTGDVLAGVGEGLNPANAQIATVYGFVPESAANQAAKPGSYSDVVTVTVAF